MSNTIKETKKRISNGKALIFYLEIRENKSIVEFKKINNHPIYIKVSERELARKVGMNRDTIRAYVSWLRKNGYIKDDGGRSKLGKTWKFESDIGIYFMKHWNKILNKNYDE